MLTRKDYCTLTFALSAIVSLGESPPRRKRQGPQFCRHLARQFVGFRGCAYDALAPAREMLAQWRARFAPGKRRKQGRPFTLSIRRNSPNSISPRSLGRPSRRHHHALLGTVQTCCVIAGWWPNGWSRLSESRFLKSAICGRTLSRTRFKNGRRNPEKPETPCGCRVKENRERTRVWPTDTI